MRLLPNIIVIVFDTARADAFEPYGAAQGSTPVVADLATSGWAAERAYATSNWTLPSHVSLFTGLLPREAGLASSDAPADVMRANEERLLGAVFRRASYETRGVSANPWISARLGFDIGFDRFELVSLTRRHAPGGSAREKARWLIDAVRARVDDGLSEIDRTVASWIDSRPQRPFLWFVNLMECHSPYLPPRPYNDLALIDRFRAGRDSMRYQSHAGFLRVCLGELDVPPTALMRMRYLYQRAVRSMDDWLGRFLGRLESARLLDDSMVIVTSDHGENLGEAHLLGHALSLDDRLIRIPLVAGGGAVPPKPDGLVSLVDIPRIVGDQAAVEHPWRNGSDANGVVVAQNDGLATFGNEGGGALAGRFGVTEDIQQLLTASRDCATDGVLKLVRTNGKEVLYDLVDDPLETKDVSAAHPEAASRLRAVLDAQMEPRDVVRGFVTDDEDPDEVADLENRMRLLGYL